jgi:hypothetical protein
VMHREQRRLTIAVARQPADKGRHDDRFAVRGISRDTEVDFDAGPD